MAGVSLGVVLALQSGDDNNPECKALYGSEPWIILHSETEQPCLSVGVHQDIQVWNKGLSPLDVSWDGEEVHLGPDDSFAPGLLEPGPIAAESALFPMPAIYVVSPSESIGANLTWTEDRVGPVVIGMTFAEALSVLPDLVVDPDLAPGPDCWHAVIAGDPYSPIFLIDGREAEQGTIRAVWRVYPSELAGKLIPATMESSCG